MVGGGARGCFGRGGELCGGDGGGDCFGGFIIVIRVGGAAFRFVVIGRRRRVLLLVLWRAALWGEKDRWAVIVFVFVVVEDNTFVLCGGGC